MTHRIRDISVSGKYTLIGSNIVLVLGCRTGGKSFLFLLPRNPKDTICLPGLFTGSVRKVYIIPTWLSTIRVRLPKSLVQWQVLRANAGLVLRAICIRGQLHAFNDGMVN